MVVAADLEKGNEPLLNLAQLVGILGVGIFDVLEGACRVNVVAGVHAHLLGVEGGDVGHARVEVDVGHEGCLEPVGTQTCADVLEVLGLAGALCGEAHQLAPGADYALGLGHARLGVVGVGGGHRLHPYRIVTAHADGSHTDGGSLAAAVVEDVVHRCAGSVGLEVIFHLGKVGVGLLNFLAQ